MRIVPRRHGLPPVPQEGCWPDSGPPGALSSPAALRCSCPTGFEGPTCEVNTDDCGEHACANGGVCVDGVGNHSCRCPLQYTGKRGGFHALNLFLAVEGPRQVSAGPAAWQSMAAASLLLPPSSPGRACEQLVDFCSPDLNPCQHEAQCVGTPDGPRSVLPGFRARQGHGP